MGMPETATLLLNVHVSVLLLHILGNQDEVGYAEGQQSVYFVTLQYVETVLA